MKLEAVIFDWAGTTVDFGCFAPVQAFVEIFKEYGIEVTMKETREPMGMLKWDHIHTMLSMPRINQCWKELYGRDFTDADVNEMHDKFTEKLMGILDQFTEPKPYVVETVQILREMGLKIGSTTGYTDEMMKVVTAGAKEKGYEPDYWISPNGVNNQGRPYPYMIFRNMEELKIKDVHHVVKVGDTISDIKEGVAAGVITVGILEGSSLMGLSEDEFYKLNEQEKTKLYDTLTKEYVDAGADYVIVSCKELPALLNNIEQII